MLFRGCMNSTYEEYHKKEKTRKENTKTNKHQCSKYSTILYLSKPILLITLSTKNINKNSCTSSISAPSLSSKLKPNKRLTWT